MRFEKRIATLLRHIDGLAYDELIEYAKKHGRNENNMEDSIELTSLPYFLYGQVRRHPMTFDYFILSGYHGSRYGKGHCELHGIYRKDDEG